MENSAHKMKLPDSLLGKRGSNIGSIIKIEVLGLIAQSIVRIDKWMELEAYVKSNNYKTVAATESWDTPILVILNWDLTVLFCIIKIKVQFARVEVEGYYCM